MFDKVTEDENYLDESWLLQVLDYLQAKEEKEQTVIPGNSVTYVVTDQELMTDFGVLRANKIIKLLSNTAVGVLIPKHSGKKETYFGINIAKTYDYHDKLVNKLMQKEQIRIQQKQVEIQERQTRIQKEQGTFNKIIAFTGIVLAIVTGLDYLSDKFTFNPNTNNLITNILVVAVVLLIGYCIWIMYDLTK